MSDQANFAIRAGQVAQDQGMVLHRAARFIDPWKQAAGKIAEARLNGRWGGRGSQKEGPQQMRAPRLQRWALGQIADWTIGKQNQRGERAGGPAAGREAARWHTPGEFQDPFDQPLQRGQQQPFERSPEQAAGGNLSQEQFGGQGDGRLGPQHGPWGRGTGPQPIG